MLAMNEDDIEVGISPATLEGLRFLHTSFCKAYKIGQEETREEQEKLQVVETLFTSSLLETLLRTKCFSRLRLLRE